ncbi:MAG TPA: NAD-dependent epimerase/dehydratase family protein [Candidatus Lokiarchaeia archaeon]|nr:NAD-dependent epimerase/dehydratase family protein [Candidatus Lokiarchaeia archaeon]
MRIFIVGGTGFLGYYSTLEALRRGHEVSTISIPDVDLGEWFPKEVEVRYGDVFEMSHKQLVETFTDYDAMVYAVGPDDRVTPKAPAYEFFHKRLVDYATRVVVGARDSGVKRCVVLNSYFAYFDRIWPELHLQDRHPYIKARVEQADSVIREGDGEMDVMVLELPYIFGTMPGRVPLWKDILVERLKKMNPVMFTTGGTNMLAVEHVGEAVVGALERGKHGEHYLVGDVNMAWKDMLALMLQAMGAKKKIVTIPTSLAAIYGRNLKMKEAKEGKEMGLDPTKLMQDIQGRFLYFDPTPHAEALGYGRGGIEDAITKTIKACL